MRNRTSAVTFTNWEVLSTNLLLHQAEFPELQASQQALAAYVDAARASIAEQAQSEGRTRDIVARRQELTRQGNHLQQYITAVLRRDLGASSPRLVEFGVRPRSLRRLPSTSPEENPAPPPSDS